MTILKEIITNSPEETENVGLEMASLVNDNLSLPPFIALYGDLGVGKTAFVRGFASVITPGAAVRSPTFSIVNEYRAKPHALFHFDMYRIESEDDLLSIGFDDYLARDGFCMTEWSENITEAIPEAVVRVHIEKNDPDHADNRRITIAFCKEGKS